MCEINEFFKLSIIFLCYQRAVQTSGNVSKLDEVALMYPTISQYTGKKITFQKNKTISIFCNLFIILLF